MDKWTFRQRDGALHCGFKHGDAPNDSVCHAWKRGNIFLAQLTRFHGKEIPKSEPVIFQAPKLRGILRKLPLVADECLMEGY